MGPIQPVSRIEPVTVHLVDKASDRQSRAHHPPDQPEEELDDKLTAEAEALDVEPEAQAKGTHLNIQV